MSTVDPGTWWAEDESAITPLFVERVLPSGELLCWWFNEDAGFCDGGVYAVSEILEWIPADPPSWSCHFPMVSK